MNMLWFCLFVFLHWEKKQYLSLSMKNISIYSSRWSSNILWKEKIKRVDRLATPCHNSTCTEVKNTHKNATFSGHMEVPFPSHILSLGPYYPNIWSCHLNIWVHPCLKYIIWLLTIYYPKILNIFGLILAFCWHICSMLAIYLPYASNIWSHDPNIWVHTRQIYNIWHPLTKSFPKIYTLLGQNGTYPYLCLTRAVQFPTSNSQIWVKITWPKS